MARKKIRKASCSFQKAYRTALRQMIKDAQEITGQKRVPKHLRVAVKSHASHLARVRCGLAKRR